MAQVSLHILILSLHQLFVAIETSRELSGIIAVILLVYEHCINVVS